MTHLPRLRCLGGYSLRCDWMRSCWQVPLSPLQPLPSTVHCPLSRHAVDFIIYQNNVKHMGGGIKPNIGRHRKMKSCGVPGDNPVDIWQNKADLINLCCPPDINTVHRGAALLRGLVGGVGGRGSVATAFHKQLLKPFHSRTWTATLWCCSWTSAFRKIAVKLSETQRWKKKWNSRQEKHPEYSNFFFSPSLLDILHARC